MDALVRVYKCPVCGSDIHISDTSLSTNEGSIDPAFRLRIETTIKHVEPIIETACGELFIELAKELAKEQKEFLVRMVERTSQNLQG